MKIFFDESGQSGCVLQKEDILNFQTQPTFAVGAVVVRDKNAEDTLVEKYNCFKQKYNIEGEIKGSDLLTRMSAESIDYLLECGLSTDDIEDIMYSSSSCYSY